MFSMRHEPSPSREELLLSTRQSLVSKIPHACGCAHECTVAKHFSLSQLATTTSDSINLTLCATNIQKANPCCAHASPLFGPDTFNREIKTLVDLGVIQNERWNSRIGNIQEEIAAFDVSVAAMVANGRYNLAEVQKSQQPIVKKLEQVRMELLQLIDDSI